MFASNIFYNLLMYTNNFCFGYIAVSCFFKKRISHTVCFFRITKSVMCTDLLHVKRKGIIANWFLGKSSTYMSQNVTLDRCREYKEHP